MFAKDMEKHMKTKTCEKGRRRRENEELQEKQAEAEEKVFEVYGEKLEQVTEFKYLGRILREDDDDTKYYWLLVFPSTHMLKFAQLQ